MLSAVVIVGILLTVITGVPVARQLKKGHPPGLFILFFAELWERFSFYGMRTLLIFYLTQHFLFDDAFASRTFGSFTTLAYLLPLLGGLLADRYLGARRAVAFGAVLLVVGHLTMAIEGPAATQSLVVDGQRYEVRTERRADESRLVVIMDGVPHEMTQSEAGDLQIAGTDGSAPPHLLPKEHFTLEVHNRQPLFVDLMFVALSLIALGVGFLKGNISTLVGQLYPRHDRRRDAGFTLYYFGINLGSFWAAILCGYLGVRYGWSWGFGLAALGMLAGLIVFVLGRRLLQGEGEPPDPARLKQPVLGPLTREQLIYIGSLLSVFVISLFMQRNELVGWALLAGSVAVLVYVGYVMVTRYSSVERQRMFLALLLVAGAVVFWTLFLQAGTSLNLFADRNTDLTLLTSPVVFDLFGHQVFLGTAAMLEAAPAVTNRVWIDVSLTAAQVQSFNVAFVLIFAPLFAWLWESLARRGMDPSPVTKFGLGLLQVGLGFFVIVASQKFADASFRVPLLVLGITYLLHTTAELCVSPVGLSELTRLSPPALCSTMMAVWLLSSSAAQYVGALIATFAATETVGGQALNAAHSLSSSVAVFNYVGWIGIIAGVFFLALNPFVRRWAHREA